jgi:hypothetical protein
LFKREIGESKTLNLSIANFGGEIPKLEPFSVLVTFVGEFVVSKDAPHLGLLLFDFGDPDGFWPDAGD